MAQSSPADEGWGRYHMDRAEAQKKLVIGLNIYRICSAEQSMHVLHGICCCLYSIMHSGHFKTVIEGPALDDCLQKLVTTLECDSRAFALVLAWDVLSMLSDHLINASAFKLLSAILADEALCARIHSSAAKHIRLAEDETYHTIVEKCLGYLTYFSSGDGPRQRALGHTPDFIKHLVAASVSFKTHHMTYGIFSTLNNILGRCMYEDLHNAVVFFSLDGLVVVQTACIFHIQGWLEHVLASGLRESEETRAVGRAFTMLTAIYGAYTIVEADLPPDLPADCEIVLALAEYVHKALSTSLYPELIKPVVYCANKAFNFLLYRPADPSVRVATMEKFLLYTPDVSSESILVWMIRWHRSEVFSNMREAMEPFWGSCGSQSPRIAAAIDAEMRRDDFPTASISGEGAARNCHFPGCMISSEHLSRAGGCHSTKSMKMCSACKSVAYCGPEHQRADWKRHKRECAKEKHSA